MKDEFGLESLYANGMGAGFAAPEAEVKKSVENFDGDFDTLTKEVKSAEQLMTFMDIYSAVQTKNSNEKIRMMNKIKNNYTGSKSLEAWCNAQSLEAEAAKADVGADTEAPEEGKENPASEKKDKWYQKMGAVIKKVLSAVWKVICYIPNKIKTYIQKKAAEKAAKKADNKPAEPETAKTTDTTADNDANVPAGNVKTHSTNADSKVWGQFNNLVGQVNKKMNEVIGKLQPKITLVEGAIDKMEHKIQDKKSYAGTSVYEDFYTTLRIAVAIEKSISVAFTSLTTYLSTVVDEKWDSIKNAWKLKTATNGKYEVVANVFINNADAIVDYVGTFGKDAGDIAENQKTKMTKAVDALGKMVSDMMSDSNAGKIFKEIDDKIAQVKQIGGLQKWNSAAAKELSSAIQKIATPKYERALVTYFFGFEAMGISQGHNIKGIEDIF